MKRCNYIALYDSTFHHYLEQTEKGIFKLKEICGRIISCESKRDGLVIQLDNNLKPEDTKDKKIMWGYEKEMPIPVVCGQELRCFYEETYKRDDIEEIKMDGYELYGIIKGVFENEGILRRGIKPSTSHKFVEFD